VSDERQIESDVSTESKPARLPKRPADGVTVVCWVGVALAFLLVGAGLAYGFGAFTNGAQDGPAIGVASFALVIALLLAPVVLLVDVWRRSGKAAAEAETAGQLRALARAIQDMTEEAALSDDARRVLNRKRERELLCRAIEEDIAVAEWDAALVLVDELAERFGYRAEAEAFRQRIEQERAETTDRQVSEAIGLLDGLIVQRRWDAAASEAERIHRIFRHSMRVSGLRERVAHARESYKEDLYNRFLEAAHEDRPDEAIELMRELDAYLTEAEAEPLYEVARGVIGRQRTNLGAQFKMAVRDKRWADAAVLGARIIDEHPNTRMAQEVREIIDHVRTKAAELGPTGSVAG